ncbi:MAG: alkene reductase [Rhizobiaceae bacterium]|nr:alkene reductase [Rhizobiaceae bacterium]
MSDTTALFETAHMGALELKNRVFMAPLTRNRAHADGTPKEMAAEYYAQRASAGLIITEATQISEMGKGYLDTPGIHSEKQVEAWKKITDAVHDKDGRIFCQLWHVGRISHTSLLPDGRSPVSSSAKKANAQTFTKNGFEDCSQPEALDKNGIRQTIEDYAHAARMAKKAGFDGVELHGANGYLVDQFLQDGVNDREDEYGGSVDNRTRFLREALNAVLDTWGADRVGLRLSPLGQANDVSESVPESLFGEAYDHVVKKDLAYLHVVETFPGNQPTDLETTMLKELRMKYSGFFIANGGYDAASGAEAVSSGHAAAIAYGRPFLANPDLPRRYELGAELNEPNPDTFYGGDEKGYTDYPFLDGK